MRIPWKELDIQILGALGLFIIGLGLGAYFGFFAGGIWADGGQDGFSVFMRTQLYRLVG